MSTSSSYWVSENGSPTDRDNVFIERVKTYSPITKAVHVLDNSAPLSPMSPGPGVQQSVMWAPEQPHQQITQIQEVQSPSPYTQETIRRYIVQNPEQVQDLQAPYTQGTIRRYIVQNPETEVQSSRSNTQETIRRYIVQNPEQVQEVQSPISNTQETIRRYIVQNPEQVQEVQSPISNTQETIRRYIVQNPEQVQEVQSPRSNTQETIRRYIVQNPEQVQEVQSPRSNTQETIRRYIVQNPEQVQEVQSPRSNTQETIRRYIVQNPEQEIQTYPQETLRRYIVQNPEQNYMKGVNYIPSNNVIYEKTVRRVEMANAPEERQTQVIRGTSVSSVNEQVIEQNNQRKVSVQSSEDVISDQHYQQKVAVQNIEQVRSSSVSSGPEQLDARYFGELLAELSRKNNDLYSCLLQHVEKIGARKPSDSEFQEEDIELVIPKGVSELTKQQIRYLLQMRQTSDKSMRLVLSTFSNLRENLVHLQDDLNKLEIDKRSLERDLTFKDAQIKEYETILSSLREKNRQQQQELKEGQIKIRSLEETILSMRNAESDKDYRLKELEYAKTALHQENKNLRVQVTETVSSPVLQTKTDEITRHYKEMIDSLRDEKDKEIRALRSQISKFQHDVMAREGSSSDLQMRMLELTSSLEERDSLIKRQQEELFRLRQQKESNSVTKEVITRQYSNNYPILRLLSDYKDTAPTTGTQTIVIERRQTSKHE